MNSHIIQNYAGFSSDMPLPYMPSGSPTGITAAPPLRVKPVREKSLIWDLDDPPSHLDYIYSGYCLNNRNQRARALPACGGFFINPRDPRCN